MEFRPRIITREFTASLEQPDSDPQDRNIIPNTLGVSVRSLIRFVYPKKYEKVQV